MTPSAAALRKVLYRRGEIAQCDDASIRVVSSPDGRRAIAFSHGREMSMMNWRWFFTLLDARGRMLNRFNPLMAVATRCAWSRDSRRFAVATTTARGEAIVVIDLAKQAFSALRVSSRQYELELTGATTLRVRFDPEQLRMTNLHSAKDTSPTERFRAPVPYVVDTRELRWHALSRLPGFDAAAVKAPRIRMDLVADGYFPFKGRYPKTTTDKISGRQLEVFHLLAFAGYGDPQAQAWLDAVKRKAGRKSVSKWDKVSKYLGRRVRRQA